MKNRNALKRKHIAPAIDVAVFDRIRAFISDVLRDACDVQIIRPGRICQKIYRMSEIFFERLFRFKQLRADFIIGQFLERAMIHGVRLDRDAALLHLEQLIPRQISVIDAGERGHHKNCRLQSVLLKDRKCIRIVVEIPVVESDQHGLLGQNRHSADAVVKFLRRDRSIAAVDEISHLLVKELRGHGERIETDADLMIIQNQNFSAVGDLIDGLGRGVRLCDRR